MGREKWVEKSVEREKWSGGKWDEKSAGERKVGRQIWEEKSGGEKSGTRKVEVRARKVGREKREKWGEKSSEESGARKVEREKW